MNLPDHIAQYLRQRDVSAESYVESVCYHEAAHAVLAIKFGVPFDGIELRPLSSEDYFSMAAVTLKAGKGRLGDLLVVTAAGPAQDQLRNGYARLPDDLLQNVVRNERSEFDKIARLGVGDAETDEIDLLCAHTMRTAKEMLSDPETSELVRRLASSIMESCATGRTIIKFNEIQQLVSVKGANNGPSVQMTRDVKQSENDHRAGSSAPQP